MSESVKVNCRARLTKLRCEKHCDVIANIWINLLCRFQKCYICTALSWLPGFHENCSMFLRQTISRRMQLVNLSFMSEENKQINPGLTYFILTAAELDSKNLQCTEITKVKKMMYQLAKLMIIFVSHICYLKYHSQLTTVWHLEKVVLFKLLEHTSFDLHKLGKPKT